MIVVLQIYEHIFCWYIGVLLSGHFRASATLFHKVEKGTENDVDSKEKYVYNKLIDQLIFSLWEILFLTQITFYCCLSLLPFI